MRISYLVWNIPKGSGVQKKIYQQIRMWVEMGHEVQCLVIGNDVGDSNVFSNIANCSVKYVRYRGYLVSLLGLNEVFFQVLAFNPDVVYTRMLLFTRVVARILQRFSVIIEINSDDVTEAELQRKRIKLLSPKYWHIILGRRLVLRKAKGLVFLTNELRNSENFSFLNSHQTTISNGVNFEDFELLDTPILQERLGLFFIGSLGQPWHGIRKILKLAELLPEFDFYLVGSDESCSLNNVYQYKFLSRIEYFKIMQKCVVGIGTLSLHQKGMNEACPLKVREYLASGLPCVVGYTDMDFSSESPSFILKLDNTEDNAVSSLESIRKFVYEWSDKRVDRSLLNQISLQNKEKQRIEFFRSVINR